MTTRTRPDGQHGFTLLELLAVVVILGVLAAIALPGFLRQRESAWQTAVASDLRSATIQMETAGVDGPYPDRVGQTERTALLHFDGGIPDRVYSVPLSPGVELAVASDGDAYCLCGYHAQLGDDPVLIYDSRTAQQVETCELADAPVCTRPTVLAAQTFTDLRFGTLGTCTGSSCTYTANRGWWGGQQIQGGPDGTISSGTLVLRDVVAGFTDELRDDGTTRPQGGWAVTYGTFNQSGNDVGRLDEGYTVQFDRTIGRFVVRRWTGGSQGNNLHAANGTVTRWDHQVEAIDLRTTDGVLRHDTVRVDVHDGELVLEVDGQEILRHDVSSVDGTFGMRNWHQTTLTVGDAELIVR